MCVLHPIVRSVFDAVHIVVLINMLRMMLAIVAIGVIVTHVMSSLRLNIVIFTMLLSREVAIVVKMRLMIFQVPVSLLEVGIRVMLITVHQLLHKWLFIPGSELKRSLFVVPITSGEVCGSIRLLSLLCRCRLCLLLSFRFWLGIRLIALIWILLEEMVSLVSVLSIA